MLFGKSKMPESMKEAKWEEMSETATNAIRFNLSDEVLNNINVENCTIVEKIWKRLEELVYDEELVKQVIFKGVVQYVHVGKYRCATTYE